jgi:hypothetical protein
VRLGDGNTGYGVHFVAAHAVQVLLISKSLEVVWRYDLKIGVTSGK